MNNVRMTCAPQIINCGHQGRRFLLKKSNSRIATIAQKTSDFSRHMVMVNYQGFREFSFSLPKLSTNQTAAFLFIIPFIILFQGHAIFGQMKSTASFVSAFFIRWIRFIPFYFKSCRFNNFRAFSILFGMGTTANTLSKYMTRFAARIHTFSTAIRFWKFRQGFVLPTHATLRDCWINWSFHMRYCTTLVKEVD